MLPFEHGSCDRMKVGEDGEHGSVIGALLTTTTEAADEKFPQFLVW